MSGILPVRSLTTREVLYGSRYTTFTYELFTHNPSTGADSLLGFLDGVQPGGSLAWSAAKSVKKSGTLTVNDLAVAGAGAIRIGDVNKLTVRIRPVRRVEGLPDEPLGMYVVSAFDEAWSETGRVFTLSVDDKSMVLLQDAVEESFTADASTPVLQIIQSVIASAGERLDLDAGVATVLANPRVWEPGTTKLRIVNDLLDAIGYNALWVDGVGAFRATPYQRPAARPILYSMLNDESGAALVRELVDGDESIYLPVWTRAQDTVGVPNRVIAVQSGTGDAEALVGLAENTNPDSPYSYPSRGRWITRVLEGVDVPDLSGPDTVAFLEERAEQTLIAAASPQSSVDVSCVPIPIELLDAVVFASTPADVRARHTVQRVDQVLGSGAVMRLSMVEVVEL